jgi:hypothetical protein
MVTRADRHVQVPQPCGDWPDKVAFSCSPLEAFRAAPLSLSHMEAPGRIVWVLDDGHSEAEELAVREDLADVFARSATINRSLEKQALTFTSLLLGILHAPDPMSKSVQDYFKRAGIAAGTLYKKSTPRDRVRVAALFRRSPPASKADQRQTA